ncbi:helix-turn-helix domain-containing protein [Kitasatospora acidiphila]|uniref:helix-turn-helix domain-containing protein n=1 Tax=Kitasatospora acidiphila TaxID=2567942 RepID=UPI0015F0C7D6
MEDRVLLVAVYCRTNLTMRQLAPPFGTSHATAHRIIGRHSPSCVRREPPHQRQEAAAASGAGLAGAEPESSGIEPVESPEVGFEVAPPLEGAVGAR